MTVVRVIGHRGGVFLEPKVSRGIDLHGPRDAACMWVYKAVVGPRRGVPIDRLARYLIELQEHVQGLALRHRRVPRRMHGVGGYAVPREGERIREIGRVAR